MTKLTLRYVGLGYMFSDRVQYLVEILGNLAWVILGVIVAVLLGWKVFRYFRPVQESREEDRSPVEAVSEIA